MRASGNRLFPLLAFIALMLAMGVVMLGAYVRLSNAGLGCPDWPGCYGHALVPDATTLFPDRPLDPGKAWREMAHRYAAGSLAVIIVVLAVMALRLREYGWARTRTFALVALVVFQALLGMWTVTLKLNPLVVMGHLIGGVTVAALLLSLVLALPEGPRPGRAWLPRLALVVVVGQMILGGWTSANYAAPFCPDFPTCQGQWWPSMSLDGVLWPELPPSAADFGGGTLGARARTAIHMTHRLGAAVTLLLVGTLAWRLIGVREHRRWGVLLAAVLLIQIGFGIANVEARFPLLLGVAHNGGALLLLLVLVAVVQRCCTPPVAVP